MKAQKGSKGIALLFFFNFGTTGGGWSTPRLGRFTPGKETRYLFYKSLGGPQGWQGRVRKISPPLGIDPRSVQPVESCNIDHASAAHIITTVQNGFVLNGGSGKHEQLTITI